MNLKTACAGVVTSAGLAALLLAGPLVDAKPKTPEPCATLATALHRRGVSVYSDTWDWRSNLFSCGDVYTRTWSPTGRLVFRASEYDRGCGRLAYDAARYWLGRGQSVLQITPAMIGRRIDTVDRGPDDDPATNDRDCALAEDWSWM